jgi:low affinity Fe/Cu permease
MSIKDVFRTLSQGTAELVGNPLSFVVTLTLILVWATFGPYCHYSNTWQLVLNSASSIIALLLLVLIANSQSRDSKALQLKLDSLLNNSNNPNSCDLINLEDRSDEEIERVAAAFEKLYRQSRLSTKAVKHLAPIN